MPNFTLTSTYQKVKSAGKISTMRVTGGYAKIVNSSTAPQDSVDAFPIYASDQPATFAANVEVWAKGSGTLHSFEVTATT